MTTMYITHQQEEFSRAYIHAVATVAGYKVFPPAMPDDDSIDLSIGTRGAQGRIRSPRVDVQAKCWMGEIVGTEFNYPLKIKNYDDLRHTDYQVPRILIVVAVPDDVNDWLHQTSEQLILRRCGYWVSLAGKPESSNTTTVSVEIPVDNVFSVEGLRGMLTRISNGETP